MEDKKQVSQGHIMNELFAKVNQLTTNDIVKTAYIKQLEEEIERLQPQASKEK
jgi:hypothetical protein